MKARRKFRRAHTAGAERVARRTDAAIRAQTRGPPLPTPHSRTSTVVQGNEALRLSSSLTAISMISFFRMASAKLS